MKLLQFLDERAKRRERRFRALLEARLPTSPLDRLPGWPSEQFIVAFSVIGLFAISYASNTNDETLKGALIAGFAGAWGYFLGSSQSAGKANDRADQALALGRDAVKALPTPTPLEPDVTLAPGETAQAEETGEEGGRT